MANSVMELLDMLYEMIDDAKGGLGGQCKIERDKALDILDEVRGRFPAEISEARKMMETRSEFMENAKADAERFRKQAEADADQLGKRAEDQARHMINEHEITAERRANELKSVANEYCEDALRRTEEAVAEALNEVRQSRSKFRSLAGLSNVSRANKTAYDVAEEE